MFVFLASISNLALKFTARPLASLPFKVMVWLPSRDSRLTPASPYHVLRDWSGLKKNFCPIVAPLSDERASADVTVNRHGEPLSMTFGSIETFNPGGADGDKTACWAAAGAVLSRAYVNSSNTAVRMTLQLMLFGFFIPDPFVTGNC